MFFAAALSIWTLLHVYVGWRVASIPSATERPMRRAILLTLAVGWLAYPVGGTLFAVGVRGPGWVLEYLGATWMGALFLMMATLMVVDVITLGGLVLRPHLTVLRSAALGLALVLTLLGILGGSRQPRVIHHELEVASMAPDAPEVRLVQISDLHLGTLIGADYLKALIDQVEALEPDAIVITGDLIDGDPGVVEELLPLLRDLKAPRGVWAVLGNHEYYAGRERARRLLAAAGFSVLDNQAIELKPGLWLAGVPDARGSAQTGAPETDLATALAGVPTDAFVVLLQHSPEGEQDIAAAGVDLMLNGHTHGGQVWPFSYLVGVIYPHLAGRYQIGSMTQIVSRGAGRWGPPMRLLAPSDIIDVTLRPAGRPIPAEGPGQ